MIYSVTVKNLKDRLKKSKLEELVVEGCAQVERIIPKSCKYNAAKVAHRGMLA